MSNIAIKVENLSKAYQLGQIGTGTVSRDLERWFAKIRGKEDPFLKIGEVNRHDIMGISDIIWSLKDLNFEIEKGEAVGIIGRNGAGKSTLLKVLSKITAPTAGKITGKGRIASLLEVGTGFHPELSGKENIYLNGAILGMRKKEIKRKFDEIVDFAGVSRYINTPVKRYSSGMYVRLAFAVAAHLESEILIVDEVLAVGDAEFQKKCLGKMGEISKGEGRTVLFVSHNMNAVMALCNKGLILENGQLEFDGLAKVAAQIYQNTHQTNKLHWTNNNPVNSPSFKYAEATLTGKQPDLKLTLDFTLGSEGHFATACVAVDIKNSVGTTIMQAIPDVTPTLQFDGEDKSYRMEIDLVGLIPDMYSLSLWIGPHNTITYDNQIDVLTFEITETPLIGRTFPHHHANGFIMPKSYLHNK